MGRYLALLLAVLPLGVAGEDKRLDRAEAALVCDASVDDDCIIRHFKDTLEASEIRGRIAFQNYCVLCHGESGEGNGRAARLHSPPPYNLTKSVAPREYISQVIRKGGEAMGRGVGMPPWGDQLTDEQLRDILNYLFSIRSYKG